MAGTAGTDRGRRITAWAGLLGAAALGAAAIALVRWAGPPMYCGDGYFHIRFSQWILEEGISRAFPWFQESFQRHAYANLNLLYHVFLMPFTFLRDLTLAARIAAVAGGTATVVAFWWSLRSLEARAPLLWTVLLLGAAPEYLFRLTFTRPLVLSLGLASLGTVAILKGKTRWAAAAAFVWAHLHSSLHLLPAVALAHDALREAPGESLPRRFRTAAWTLGGVAAGLLVSPFFPNNVRFWAIANFGVLRHAWERGDEARVATELAATEEFEMAGWDEETVAEMLADLADLARLAETQEQSLFVWMQDFPDGIDAPRGAGDGEVAAAGGAGPAHTGIPGRPLILVLAPRGPQRPATAATAGDPGQQPTTGPTRR